MTRILDFDDGFESSTAPTQDTFRAGSESIGSGVSTISPSFGTAMPDATYKVIATFENTTDVSPDFQPITITAKTTSGFTAKWNAPTDTANYVLNWFVVTDL